MQAIITFLAGSAIPTIVKMVGLGLDVAELIGKIQTASSSSTDFEDDVWKDARAAVDAVHAGIQDKSTDDK